jgi:ribosomal protein L37AE/L43A
MKLITDNAFDKAWKKSCPTCEPQQVNRILWFREQCDTCDQQELKNALTLLKYMKGVENALHGRESN